MLTCVQGRRPFYGLPQAPLPPIKTHFPALIGLEGRGSQSGYCIGLAHSGCSLSGPRLCHVSGQAISSLALRSALRPKETAFWGSEGCSVVERCGAFAPYRDDWQANIHWPQWYCLRTSARSRKSCYPKPCPGTGQFNVLSLCFLFYEMGPIISALELVVRLKVLLDDQ